MNIVVDQSCLNGTRDCEDSIGDYVVRLLASLPPTRNSGFAISLVDKAALLGAVGADMTGNIPVHKVMDAPSVTVSSLCAVGQELQACIAAAQEQPLEGSSCCLVKESSDTLCIVSSDSLNGTSYSTGSGASSSSGSEGLGGGKELSTLAAIERDSAVDLEELDELRAAANSSHVYCAYDLRQVREVLRPRSLPRAFASASGTPRDSVVHSASPVRRVQSCQANLNASRVTPTAPLRRTNSEKGTSPSKDSTPGSVGSSSKRVTVTTVTNPNPNPQRGGGGATGMESKGPRLAAPISSVAVFENACVGPAPSTTESVTVQWTFAGAVDTSEIDIVRIVARRLHQTEGAFLTNALSLDEYVLRTAMMSSLAKGGSSNLDGLTSMLQLMFHSNLAVECVVSLAAGMEHTAVLVPASRKRAVLHVLMPAPPQPTREAAPSPAASSTTTSSGAAAPAGLAQQRPLTAVARVLAAPKAGSRSSTALAALSSLANPTDKQVQRRVRGEAIQDSFKHSLVVSAHLHDDDLVPPPPDLSEVEVGLWDDDGTVATASTEGAPRTATDEHNPSPALPTELPQHPILFDDASISHAVPVWRSNTETASARTKAPSPTAAEKQMGIFAQVMRASNGAALTHSSTMLGATSTGAHESSAMACDGDAETDPPLDAETDAASMGSGTGDWVAVASDGQAQSEAMPTGLLQARDMLSARLGTEDVAFLSSDVKADATFRSALLEAFLNCLVRQVISPLETARTVRCAMVELCGSRTVSKKENKKRSSGPTYDVCWSSTMALLQAIQRLQMQSIGGSTVEQEVVKRCGLAACVLQLTISMELLQVCAAGGGSPAKKLFNRVVKTTAGALPMLQVLMASDSTSIDTIDWVLEGITSCAQVPNASRIRGDRDRTRKPDALTLMHAVYTGLIDVYIGPVGPGGVVIEPAETIRGRIDQLRARQQAEEEKGTSSTGGLGLGLGLGLGEDSEARGQRDKDSKRHGSSRRSVLAVLVSKSITDLVAMEPSPVPSPAPLARQSSTSSSLSILNRDREKETEKEEKY